MPSLPTCSSSTLRVTFYPLRSTSCRYAHARYYRTSSVPDETLHPSTAKPVDLPRRSQTKSAVDTWIRPNSLAKTLAEHRDANRSGKARDGVATKVARTVQQSPKRNKDTDARVINVTDPALLKRLRDDDRQQHSDNICRLTTEWKASRPLIPALRLPWMRELSKLPDVVHNISGLQRLGNEIRAGNSYLSPTLLERQAASKALSEIGDMVDQALSGTGVKIQLIGSRITGLDNPMSDIDINLRAPVMPEGYDAHALTTLKALYAQMRFSKTGNDHRSHFIPNKFLQRSAVPIIDCTHAPSGMGFQIQHTTSGYASLELSKAFVAEYPTLCSLYRIIKQMLLIRGLTDGWQHGLTSYPLLNMIVTSLKLGQSPKDMTGLGSQLLEFLEFFASIDFETTAIRYTSTHNPVDELGFTLAPADSADENLSIDPITASPALRKIRGRPSNLGGSYLMSLQDPASPINDLGRSAHTIRQTQVIFIKAHYQISESIREWDAKLSSGADMKQHGFPLLAWCLEADYTSFEESRHSLRRYALT